MKAMIQWLATVCLVVAGIVLLVRPAGAAVTFTPTRFSVADSGTTGKPDVILIPGLASSAAVWDVEAKRLAPNYRLHIVQVAGFAGAPAGPNATGDSLLPSIVSELHEYIAANKMHPVVVGHSLGGLLVLMLADKYPQDVRKMIVVDSLPFYGALFSPDATVEAIKPQAEAMKQQLVMASDEQFAAIQPMMVAGMVANEDARKLVVHSSIASNRAVFAEAMFEDLQTDVRSDLKNIQTPMLLLYPYDGTLQKDETRFDKTYHDAYAAKPNLTITRIDGSRHFIMYDQPEKMDAAMEAFLK
jgi:pimeloyl-ACP methyl ester carboxylesterase